MRDLSTPYKPTRNPRWLTCTLLLTASLTLALADPPDDEEPISLQAPWSGETLGAGATRPTPEQWAWGEENMIKGKRVRFNALGLQRANEVRGRHGKSLLRSDEVEVAGVGAEVSTDESASTMADAPGSLPTYVDNSALPYFPPIRSQGSLNSCGQFAAVYYALTHMYAMAHNLNAKTGGDTLRFSPKWTYNMLNGGGNNGTWHYEAYALAQKHGLATWAEFPYDSNYRAWCLNPTVWRNALFARAATSGKILDVDTEAGLSQIKQLLNNGYVLNFATYINSWGWSTLRNDPATAADDAFVGKQAVIKVAGTSVGHAMTIVGYNDDLWVDLNADGLVAANEKGALRIANSWGTGWGEAGYCWVAYNALRTRNTSKTSEGLFWYDEATWVTVRTSYAPKLIAEFDLSHLKRNQLVMNLGVSALTATAPSSTWAAARVLSSAGGAYAFDGTTVVRNGTFCLDLTDLVPATGGARRYYLGMRDSTSGDTAVLNSFKLVDMVNGNEIACAQVPKLADASQVYTYADYDAGSGVIPPLASGTAQPTSGYVGLTVFFDASSSTSPNGNITSYTWNFGDGSTSSGMTCQHTYTRAGVFNATLTVTDSAGATSADSTQITVVDPNVVAAPSNLRVAASSRTVTLNWSDNSLNETSFVIERAVKPNGNGSYVYSSIASTGANTPSFRQTVLPGTYNYRVRAVNSATGTASGYSNIVSIRVK